MKLISILAAAGLILLLAVQLNTPDLRGWPPEKGPDDLAGMAAEGAVLQPSRPGGQCFKLADCVPRTISTDVPTVEEYSGTATLAVVTCRSRAGAMANLAIYVAGASILLIAIHAVRRRGATPT